VRAFPKRRARRHHIVDEGDPTPTDGRRVPTIECASDVLAALSVRSADLRRRLSYPFQARRQKQHTKSIAEMSRNQIRLIEAT